MTIPKPKKRKKSVSIVKQLDAMVRKIVLERDGATCVICGSTQYPQVSHFFGKGRYPRLRWNLENVHVNCRSCHFKHHHGGQEYIAWFFLAFGQIQYSRLLSEGSKTMSSAERKLFMELTKRYLIDLINGKTENLKERT